ncbi:MAG TPA: acyl-CoA carboxylase subunit epsilon [Trebonia sp.]
MSLVDRPAGEPFLTVVRGNPTPEEIAALVAVLLERESDAGPAPRSVRPTRSAWADPAHVLRLSRHRVPARGSRVLPGA